MKKNRILIHGSGRVGKAIVYFLRSNRSLSVQELRKDSDAANCDLLIGVLAGELGKRSLKLALKYKKNLIDVADIDPPDYLKRKKEIEEADITVLPGCGFSPGLVNAIVGHEFNSLKGISSVEVKAGSLSKEKNYYPFLWCFEDLVLCHELGSWQLVEGKKKKFPALAGLRKEKFLGIEAESCLAASGFEQLFNKDGLKDFTYRVIRPYGFYNFFKFLKNQGFLAKENLMTTKNIVEKNLLDNFTLGELNFRSGKKKVRWLMKSFSGKAEPLNSMQKITAIVPSVMAGLLLSGRLKGKGLVFMEEVGRDKLLFKELLSGVGKKIFITRREQELR